MKKLIDIFVGLGIVSLFITPLFYLLAWHYQATFATYQSEGIKRKAGVADKSSRSGGKTTNYYVKVTYFDRSIRENGQFYMEEVEVNAKVWKKVKEGTQVKILLLQDKPDKPILELSTLSENPVPFEQYSSGHFTLMLCLLALIFSRFSKKIDVSSE